MRDANTGYIAACNRARELKGESHTITFKWHTGGTFTKGEAGFDIHTTCLINNPEFGLLQASASGIFSFVRQAGPMLGNIFKDSSGADGKERYGDIRSVVSIGDMGYAVGYGGVVYRLDKDGWICVDAGLPSSFDIEAMAGFDADHRVAVGLKGQIYTWNGKMWKERSSSTNVMLSAVCCANNGITYVAGQGGVVLAGGDDTWEPLVHDFKEKIYDLAWFEDHLYVSTQNGIFRLTAGKNLERIDFGDDSPKTTYQLSTASNVLWSVGSRDIMSFDGNNWGRIV